MKKLIIVNAVIIILGVVTMLAQLWIPIFDAETFRKVILTEIALLVICLVITFVKKEMNDTRRLKNGE